MFELQNLSMQFKSGAPKKIAVVAQSALKVQSILGNFNITLWQILSKRELPISDLGILDQTSILYKYGFGFRSLSLS